MQKVKDLNQGNFDRQTDRTINQPTERPTNRRNKPDYREVTLQIMMVFEHLRPVTSYPPVKQNLLNVNWFR